MFGGIPSELPPGFVFLENIPDPAADPRREMLSTWKEFQGFQTPAGTKQDLGFSIGIPEFPSESEIPEFP